MEPQSLTNGWCVPSWVPYLSILEIWLNITTLIFCLSHTNFLTVFGFYYRKQMENPVHKNTASLSGIYHDLTLKLWTTFIYLVYQMLSRRCWVFLCFLWKFKILRGSSYECTMEPSVHQSTVWELWVLSVPLNYHHFRISNISLFITKQALTTVEPNANSN